MKPLRLDREPVILNASNGQASHLWETLIELAELQPVSWTLIGGQMVYLRGDVSVDVLAPEGLGERTDLTTTPPGHTIQVPGGTQALKRTELNTCCVATAISRAS